MAQESLSGETEATAGVLCVSLLYVWAGERGGRFGCGGQDHAPTEREKEEL